MHNTLFISPEDPFLSWRANTNYNAVRTLLNSFDFYSYSIKPSKLIGNKLTVAKILFGGYTGKRMSNIELIL